MKWNVILNMNKVAIDSWTSNIIANGLVKYFEECLKCY